MGRARALLVAGILLTLTPVWQATHAARAAGGFGIAASDFTKTIPANAVLFASVQATAADQATNISTLETAIMSKVNLRQLLGSQSNTMPNMDLMKSISQVEDALSAVFNGETAVAMLPPTTTTNAKGKAIPQFHILVEAGLKPGVGALALQSALLLGALQGTTTSTYKGVTVTTLDVASLLKMAQMNTRMGTASAPTEPVTATVSFAVVANTAILSGDLTTLDAAIDTAQGNAPALDSSSAFQSTLAQLPDSRAATIFVHADLQAEHQLIQALQPGRSVSAMPASGTYSQAFAIGAQATGILVTASPTVTTGAFVRQVSLSPFQNATAAALPAGTLVYGAINDPGSLIQQMLTQFASLAASTNAHGLAIDPLKVVNRLLGIDLNQDVLSWMHGEASVAVLPSGDANGKTPAARRLSMVVTLKVDDPNLVQQKLRQILTAVQSLSDDPSRLQFVPTTATGGVVEQVLAATPTGTGYAFVNGYLVVATALPADVAALQAVGSGAGLADDPGFQAAIQATGAGQVGAVLYANLRALRQTLEQVAQDEGVNLTRYDARVQPVLSLFTSLTITARPGAAGGGALFLGIAS
jgi:hypothetical protein